MLNHELTKEELQNLVGKQDIIGRYFQIEVDAFGKDFAECSMPLLDIHKNPLGIAHGGAIFSLADMCFEAACHGAGRFCVNSQTSISFLNKGVGERLYARAELLKAGSKMVVYGVSIRNRDRSIVAQGQITGYCLGNVEEIMPANNI